MPTWVYSTSSNPTVISITLEAVSGLPLSFAPISSFDMLKDTLSRICYEDAFSTLRRTHYSEDDSQERLIRSLLFFSPLAQTRVYQDSLSNLAHAFLSRDTAVYAHVDGDPTRWRRLHAAILALCATRVAGRRWAQLFNQDIDIQEGVFGPFTHEQDHPSPALQLPAPVWHYMLEYIAGGSQRAWRVGSSVKLGMLFWQAREAEVREDASGGAITLVTMCRERRETAALVADVIHRMVCRVSEAAGYCVCMYQSSYRVRSSQTQCRLYARHS